MWQVFAGFAALYAILSLVAAFGPPGSRVTIAAARWTADVRGLLARAPKDPRDPPNPPPMVHAIILAFGLAASVGSTGCTMTFEEARAVGVAEHKPAAAPRDDARCRDLSTAQHWWKATATAGLVASGVSGATSIPVPEEYRMIPIGISVGTAVTAAFAKVIADGLAEDWARECAS
jgi:hypothetical protein